jgi:hypothetical protein
MNDRKSKTIGSVFSISRNAATATLTLLLALAWPASAEPGNDNRAPELPGAAATLAVSAGKVHFHVYAVGVQIYTGTPSATSPTGFSWTFTGPEAVLFDADGNVVGIHYAFAGPTRPAWETESGSLVVGARRVPAVTVDPTAIPWLLLEAVQTEGPGVLERTTYIQRVNTAGGLAPAALPTAAGQEARVPYTTEYYFYRAN